jgi:formylglycine-generating enzyme required for sulfatase activity
MRSERLLIGAAAVVLLVFSLSCGNGGGGGPTGPEVTPPRAPSDVQVTLTAADQITLIWRNNELGATGFKVERALGEPSGFTQVDTLPSSTPTYVDTQVTEGQKYYYRIRTAVRTNVSDPSESVWAIATTNGTPSAPSSPDPADEARDIEAGTVTLRWTATDPDAGDTLLYDVYFGKVRNEMEIIAEATSATEVTPSEEVTLNSHYFWQVKARDTKGAMGVSPVWGFSTRVERVEIPEGWLLMGDRSSSAEFHHPGLPVWVDAFEIDKYEVTNQQFVDLLNQALRRKYPLITTSGGRVYDAGGTVLFAVTNEANVNSQITYSRADSLFTALSGKESFPAVEVTWNGADFFARYYSRRLPTEAEWELAARGNEAGEYGDSTFTVGPDSAQVQITVGFGRPYPWGATLDPRRANYSGSADPYEGQGRVHTTPVGYYDGSTHGGYETLDGQSPYGVADMAGNVWEWTADWYGPYSNPHNPPYEGTHRIIRGGGWSKGSGSIETWNRSIAAPETPDWAVGFRTAKSLP